MSLTVTCASLVSKTDQSVHGISYDSAADVCNACISVKIGAVEVVEIDLKCSL